MLWPKPHPVPFLIQLRGAATAAYNLISHAPPCILAECVSLRGSRAQVSYFGEVDTFINIVPVYCAIPSTSLQLLFHLLRGARALWVLSKHPGVFKSLFTHHINAPVLEV